MARIRFMQVAPLADSKETHRAGPTKVWGVFLGWKLEPGGRWTKRYIVAALTEFIRMDLRVGGHIRTQEVAEVDFDEDKPVYFPLKDMYDRAHGTLEGLSAPYGMLGDVAPQGLKDLGVFPEDTGPVGQELGDDDEEPPELIPDLEPDDADPSPKPAAAGDDATPQAEPPKGDDPEDDQLNKIFEELHFIDEPHAPEEGVLP